MGSASKKNILSNKLNIWGFQDDTIIYKCGSLGCIFELSMHDPCNWTDDEFNLFAKKKKNFLNSLHEGLQVQFIFKSKGYENNELCDASDNSVSDSQVVKSLQQEKGGYFRKLNQQRQLRRLKLYVLVKYRLVGAGKQKNVPLKVQTKDFDEAAYKKFLSLAKNVKENLDLISPRVVKLGQRQLAELIFEHWNPERLEGIGRFNPEYCCEDLVLTDSVLSDLGFRLGRVKHRVLSLKILPEQTFCGMTEILKQLPLGCDLYLSIYSPYQEKELENLKSQRRMAFSMVSANQNKVRDLESEAKFGDTEKLLEEMVANGEKVFHMALSVVVRSTDENALEEKISKVILQLREIGIEIIDESYPCFDIFTQISLPNGGCRERVKKLKSSNLADFLPVFGSWEGHQYRCALLRGSYGQRFHFDPFDGSLTNANQIISGASGSGKSFLTNSLNMQMLKDDARIYIIDIGGSYQKLTRVLGGQYIPLGVDNGMTLNPFDLKKGQDQPDSQKIKFLLTLVEIMTSDNQDTGLSKLVKAEIEKSIIELYQKQSCPKLSHLKNVLLKYPENEIKNLGRILGLWTGNTPFGNFLDKDTNIEVDSKIICFDLKGLESFPDLQAACLYIITDLIWRKVQEDKSVKKVTVFDECWKLLENKAGAAFIGEVFRTYRKYYASAIAISQTMDDFAKSNIADAILPNASIKWLLKQKGANLENLQKVLALNEREINTVANLAQKKGEYSEVFLISGDQKTKLLVESTPLEYWIGTTDPKDLIAIEQTRESYPNLNEFEQLQFLANKYPKGISYESTNYERE